MGSRRSMNLLAPGFRFHPTDEELVRYYLRRKIYGKPLRYDAISDIDIYKVEPWDLPGMSRLKTGDLEWYFFSVLDKKYGNGARTNRATERGYWKTTGKDRSVYHKSQLVGMKKTLVYHTGRAPRGQRTNWVMHEYRMIDGELDKAGIPQDAFVLCRIFQKSGAGPKNGEQYGAPFVEEEWEDDELQMDPRYAAAAAVDFEFGDNIYLDVDDIEQILGDIDVDGAPISMNSHDGENGSSEVINNSSEVAQKWMQHPDEQKPDDLAVQQNVDANLVGNELIGGSSESVNCIDLDYLLNDPLLNSTDDLQFDDGAFLEANDLANPIEVDNSSFDVEEFLTFFDANSDFQNTGFDPSVLIGNEDHISEQAPLAEKNADEATQQLTAPGEHFDGLMPSEKVEPTKSGSGYQYQFMKQASQMLGNIPAPPALASEFPTKDAAALRLNSVAQSSSSVHVTAGLIEISNMTAGGNGTDWLLGKHGEYNIVLSFGLSRGSDNSASLESVCPGKTNSIISRGWFYYTFFSVLLLAMSFNIGTLICAR